MKLRRCPLFFKRSRDIKWGWLRYGCEQNGFSGVNGVRIYGTTVFNKRCPTSFLHGARAFEESKHKKLIYGEVGGTSIKTGSWPVRSGLTRVRLRHLYVRASYLHMLREWVQNNMDTLPTRYFPLCTFFKLNQVKMCSFFKIPLLLKYHTKLCSGIFF